MYASRPDAKQVAFKLYHKGIINLATDPPSPVDTPSN